MGNAVDKIIPGVYLGGIRAATKVDILDDLDISHVLAIHDNASPIHDDRHYLCITARDNSRQNIAQFFSDSNDFIHRTRLDGNNVLVHCFAGVSRSAALVIAYILTVTNMEWREALKATRAARISVNPNYGFQRQLADFYHNNLAEEKERLFSKFGSDLPFNDEEELRALLASSNPDDLEEPGDYYEEYHMSTDRYFMPAPRKGQDKVFTCEAGAKSKTDYQDDDDDDDDDDDYIDMGGLSKKGGAGVKPKDPNYSSSNNRSQNNSDDRSDSNCPRTLRSYAAHVVRNTGQAGEGLQVQELGEVNRFRSRGHHNLLQSMTSNEEVVANTSDSSVNSQYLSSNALVTDFQHTLPNDSTKVSNAEASNIEYAFTEDATKTPQMPSSTLTESCIQYRSPTKIVSKEDKKTSSIDSSDQKVPSQTSSVGKAYSFRYSDKEEDLKLSVGEIDRYRTRGHVNLLADMIIADDDDEEEFMTSIVSDSCDTFHSAEKNCDLSNELSCFKLSTGETNTSQDQTLSLNAHVVSSSKNNETADVSTAGPTFVSPGVSGN